VPRVSGLAVGEWVEEEGIRFTLLGALAKGVGQSQSQRGRKYVLVYQKRIRCERQPRTVVVVWQVEVRDAWRQLQFQYFLGQK